MSRSTSSASDQSRARTDLGRVAATLRPDWDPVQIHAVIEAMHRDRHPLGVIALRTIEAAITPGTRTPAGIAARIADPITAAAPPSPATSRCPKCGFVVTVGESHSCGRVLDPDETRQAAARARAALRASAGKDDQ